MVQRLVPAVIVAGALGFGVRAQAARTVLDGAYTEAQADFRTNCSRCHGDNFGRLRHWRRSL